MKPSWIHLKISWRSASKGIDHFNALPRGRGEIHDYKAIIHLHPVLNDPNIMSKILNEFGLTEEIHGLSRIRVVRDLTNQYRVEKIVI